MYSLLKKNSKSTGLPIDVQLHLMIYLMTWFSQCYCMDQRSGDMRIMILSKSASKILLYTPQCEQTNDKMHDFWGPGKIPSARLYR